MPDTMKRKASRPSGTSPQPLGDAGIEAFLCEAFEANYERLHLETGHTLPADLKTTAWEQTLLYWRRLAELARRVTETEVRLTLPDQRTPKGRGFGIEGVVDIVREDGRTVMYDLKTHDADVVRSHIPDYARQLNIYAHIWRHLRGQPLDETAIIATPLPAAVKEALDSGNKEALEIALAGWEPVVPVPFSDAGVSDAIADFGATVDSIEEGCFRPPPAARLRRKDGGKETFADRVCANCDARHSCDSYREHKAGKQARRTKRGG